MYLYIIYDGWPNRNCNLRLSSGMLGLCMALGSKIFLYSNSFTGWVSPGTTRTATAHSGVH